jgi:hypothetical protein
MAHGSYDRIEPLPTSKSLLAYRVYGERSRCILWDGDGFWQVGEVRHLVDVVDDDVEGLSASGVCAIGLRSSDSQSVPARSNVITEMERFGKLGWLMVQLIHPIVSILFSLLVKGGMPY